MGTLLDLVAIGIRLHIQRLEKRAWIEAASTPEGEEESGGPVRRFYALTDSGRAALAEELGRLQSILDTAAGKALSVRRT